MKNTFASILFSFCWVFSTCFTAGAVGNAGPAFHDLKVQDINGKTVDMAQYKGKVVLVVNTASNCGYTPQYEGLEALYQKYQGKGLVVLGFPSNDFGGQEPGSNEEIKKFCDSKAGKYKISFPLFAKSSVKTNPVYSYLTNNSSSPGPIDWNFEKFVVGKDGKILGRYKSKIQPQDPQIIKTIEAGL